MTTEGGYRRLKDNREWEGESKKSKFFFENAIAKPNTCYAD